MPLSPELKEIYASPPADDSFVETLTLAHSTFGTPFFLTNEYVGFNATLEDLSNAFFQPVGFNVVQPKRNQSARSDMQITIDNIGAVMMQALEAAIAVPEDLIEATFRIYLWSDKSEPQNNPPIKLTLSDIVVTSTLVTGTASRADILNRPFPSVLYRTETWPGLAR